MKWEKVEEFFLIEPVKREGDLREEVERGRGGREGKRGEGERK